MNVLLIVVQIIASIALIGLILMQQGKGADAGASFGAGASQTFFGSAGSANAVTKMTAIFAAIFFLASLGLAYVAQQEEREGLQRELSEQLAPATQGAKDTVNTGLVPTENTSDALNEGLVPVEEDAVDAMPAKTAPAETLPATNEAESTEAAPAAVEENTTVEPAPQPAAANDEVIEPAVEKSQTAE